MQWTNHKTNNMILGAPSDGSMPDCQSLPATMLIDEGYTIIASFWKPTAEELAILNAEGLIKLNVFGTMHPPVMIDVVKG